MHAVSSLQQALGIARGEDAPELCVIGGGEIFELALPVADTLRLTFVDTLVAGADAFFPPLDISEWRELDRQQHAADSRHAFAFEFVDYARER